MLSWQFIQSLNQENDRQVTGIEDAAFECLMQYRWPGNIRELSNVMEYAHAIGEGETIFERDLPPELRGEEPPDEREETVENLEREQILELMRLNQGHKQKVADAMGISRATLWRKMKTLGLS
jgi:two-component system response regulator AtoC